MKVSLTANSNWIQQPDPFRAPILSVEDYIAVEKKLFGSGYYNSTENNASHPVLTPVIETLILQRDGVISETEASSRIEQLG
ncbi:hypothetical protein ACWKSR_12565, partial [Campylobacter fetus subsp. venerealis]